MQTSLGHQSPASRARPDLEPTGRQIAARAPRPIPTLAAPHGCYARAHGLAPLVRHPQLWVQLDAARPEQVLRVSGDVMARQSELWANMLEDVPAGGRLAHEPLSIGKALAPRSWYDVLAHMHEVAPCAPTPQNLVDVHAAVDFLLPRAGEGGLRLRALSEACTSAALGLTPAALAQAYARALALPHPAMCARLAELLWGTAGDEAVTLLPQDALAALLQQPNARSATFSSARRARLVLGWIVRQALDTEALAALIARPEFAALAAPDFWPPGQLRNRARALGLVPAASCEAARAHPPPPIRTPWLARTLRITRWLPLDVGATRRLWWLDGHTLAASQTPQLALFDVGRGAERARLALGHGAALAVRQDDDGLDCVTHQGELTQWVQGDGAQQVERQALLPPSLPYDSGNRAAAIDAHWIALGTGYGAVRVYARGEAAPTASLNGLRGSVEHLAFWGDELVGADALGNLWRWQVTSGHCLAAGHFAGRKTLALQLDAAGILCAGTDLQVPVYDRHQPGWRDRRVDPAGFVEAHGPRLEADAGWRIGTEASVLGLGASADHVVAAMPTALLILRRDDGQALRLIQAVDLMRQFRCPPPRVTAVALCGEALAVATTGQRQEPPFGQTVWRHKIVVVRGAPPTDLEALPYRPPPASWRWPWPFS